MPARSKRASNGRQSRRTKPARKQSDDANDALVSPFANPDAEASDGESEGAQRCDQEEHDEEEDIARDDGDDDDSGEADGDMIDDGDANGEDNEEEFVDEAETQCGDDEEDEEQEEQEEEEEMTPSAPVSKGRGRPRKAAQQPTQAKVRSHPIHRETRCCG